MALIGSPEWFFEKGQTREFQLIIEDMRVDFLERFSPEKLSKMTGDELLENVFGNRDDAMCQLLAFDNREPYSYRWFGAAGPYVEWFMVYKKKGSIKWTIKESQKTDVSEAEAKLKAKEIVDKLVKCTETIAKSAPLSTIGDYIELNKKLSSVSFYSYAWVLKYFQMVFPQFFPGMYSDDTLIRALEILGLPNHGKKSRFVNAGEISLFIRKCRLNNIVFNDVYADEWDWKGNRPPCQSAKENYENRTTIAPVDLSLYKFPKNDVAPVSFEAMEEAQYINELSQTAFDETKIADVCVPAPVEAPQAIVGKTAKTYPRDIEQAKYALARAKHKCEYNDSHWTFTRRIDDLPYTEAHHLIPMSQQDLFEHSLDVPANIVSLCSSCHNLIHYGKDIERKGVLIILFNQRKEELKKAGIDIDIQAFLKMYLQ